MAHIQRKLGEWGLQVMGPGQDALILEICRSH